MFVDTNRKAQRKIAEWNSEQHDVQRNWIPVDDTDPIPVDNTAFIGLNILAGLHKSNHKPILSLWSKKKDLFTLQLCLGINLLTF